MFSFHGLRLACSNRKAGAAGDACRRVGTWTSRSNAWIVGHSTSCSAAAGRRRCGPFAPNGLAAAEPLKAGFVYLGPVGDFGWTYQHDVARKEARTTSAAR